VILEGLLLIVKNYSLMIVPEAGRIRQFSISRSMLVSASVMAVALVSFGIWGVYSTYKTEQFSTSLEQTRHALDHAQARYDMQMATWQDKTAASQKKLAVYARTLGQIQARLSRLDALGSKLADVASLDKSEFDFGVQPAFGGPRQTQLDLTGLEEGVTDGLQYLDGRLEQLDTQLAAINFMLEKDRTVAEAKPHAWPTEGGWLSSNYGHRADPFTGQPASHFGVDIANRFAAPVLAASRGIVTFAGKMKDFGYMVDVDHGYGYKTRYGHMSSLAVKVGDVVDDNQLLGRIGSSGRSTGPHLHYEVHLNGNHINPASFLPRG